MKKLVFVVALLAIFSIDAKPKGFDNKGTHPMQYKRRVMLYQNGGLVPAPATGKCVRIVNIDNAAEKDMIDAAATGIRQTVRFPVTIVSVKDCKQLKPDSNAVVSIYLKSTDNDPRLLVAPEDAWSSINVKALAKDNPTAEVLKTRFIKECWRGLAISLGASNSQMQPCIMHEVRELKDLDENDLLVPSPEPFNKMMMSARQLGIEPGKMVTYRTAVKEGWAPDPVDEVQRKIKANPDVEIVIPENLQQELDKLLVPTR